MFTFIRLLKKQNQNIQQAAGTYTDYKHLFWRKPYTTKLLMIRRKAQQGSVLFSQAWKEQQELEKVQNCTRKPLFHSSLGILEAAEI